MSFSSKKISKFISISFVIISLSMFLFLFIRSKIYDLSLVYYKKYWILVGIFFLFSIISFFINHKININLFIITTSILSSIYLIEFTLNILEWNNRVGDKRSVNKFYKSKLNEYDQITTLIPPSAFLSYSKDKYFPLSLAPNYFSVTCNETGQYIINKNDRYGFNTKDQTWDENEIDFIFLGDSFTYGSCVSQNNNIDGHIRKISKNKKDILNLGMPGNGPLISYAALREYFPKKKKIKYIVMFFYINDFQNIENEKKNFFLNQYLKNDKFSQNLISRPDYHLKNYLKKNYQRNHQMKFEFLRLTKLRMLLNSLIMNPYDLEKYYTQDNLNYLKDILLKINSNYKDSKLFIVYLPSYSYYFGNKSHILDIQKKKEELFNEFNNLGLSVLDLDIEFQKIKNKRSLFSKHKKQNHYSSYGYETSAKSILSFVNQF